MLNPHDTGMLLEHVFCNFTLLLITKPWTLCVLAFMCSSCQSASIATLSSAPHQLQLLSNPSYRNLFLRQYILDSLNHSHPALLQTMFVNQHFTAHLEQIQSRRRKRFTNNLLASTPLLTLHSTNCYTSDTRQARSIFEWSHSTAVLSSVELVYHIESDPRQAPAVPVRMVIKQASTSHELVSLQTWLQYDSTRKFYFLNVLNYIQQHLEQSLVIETTIANQTCHASHAYLIVSSLRVHPPATSETTKCQLQTVTVRFEELGLADLFIRPKEYTFTYCHGSCTDLTPERNSLHAFLQSMISRRKTGVPQPTCVPTHYADDHFLLRLPDGNMQIYPLKDMIVKQCACT